MSKYLVDYGHPQALAFWVKPVSSCPSPYYLLRGVAKSPLESFLEGNEGTVGPSCTVSFIFIVRTKEAQSKEDADPTRVSAKAKKSFDADDESSPDR